LGCDVGRIKAFFYCLKRTFTSPDYYADILKAPFSFSLKFFYGFFFLYALILTSFVTVRYLLPLGDLLKFLPDKLVEMYPSELEVTIKDGEVSTNVAEPYAIPLSRFEKILDELDKSVLGESVEKVENLVVIDTRGKIDDFSRYRTYVLLTKKPSFVY